MAPTARWRRGRKSDEEGAREEEGQGQPPQAEETGGADEGPRLQLLLAVLRSRGHTRPFLLASLSLFAAAVVLAYLGFATLALVPALLGFGLSLVGLLHAVFPPLATWMDGFPRPATFGIWALLAGLLAFVGFSSTVVILLVLLLGGFITGLVLWRLFGRVLGISEPQPGSEKGEPEDEAGVWVLATVALVVTGSLGGSFFMGLHRLHEEGALGVALVFGNAGLLLGVLPTVASLLHVGRTNAPGGDALLRPLLRDLAFAALLTGLVGYEISFATNGEAALPSIPTAVLLAIVLLGYLGVLGRFVVSLGGDLRPHNPLFVASFGVLLLMAPTVVVLSNPPTAVTRLYGAAQAAGLLAAVLYLGLVTSWEEEIDRLNRRLREALDRGVSLQVSIGEGPEEKKRKGGRIRRFFARRRERKEERSDG